MWGMKEVHLTNASIPGAWVLIKKLRIYFSATSWDTFWYFEMLLVAFFIYISFRNFPKVATSKSKSKSKSNIWKELKGGKSKGVKKGLKALQKKKEKKKQGLKDVSCLEPPTATAAAPPAAASAVANSTVAAEMLLLVVVLKYCICYKN